MAGCFDVVASCIVDLFHFSLIFVTFFTACNFHKLLFTVEKGQGNCFISFIHCSGGRGVP